MVPDETSDLPTTLPEASFLNPNRKVPSEARSLRGLFPVPVFAEFPSYSLSKNADGFLQNPFWLSYCNLRKLKDTTPFLYLELLHKKITMAPELNPGAIAKLTYF